MYERSEERSTAGEKIFVFANHSIKYFIRKKINHFIEEF